MPLTEEAERRRKYGLSPVEVAKELDDLRERISNLEAAYKKLRRATGMEGVSR